jgi:hypothetical protein
MTKLIILGTAIAGMMAFAACTTVKDRDPAPQASSTTTESTTVQPVIQPVPATTETQTVRTY